MMTGNKKNFQVEACVTSLEDAARAQSKHADRIEICARLETEGMTPAFEMVKEVCNTLSIPVRVMIRETPNGFEAGEEILEKMIYSIIQLRQLPIDGFVIGVIKNHAIDRNSMTLLLEAAYPVKVTFHKAIDLCAGIAEEINWINMQPQIDTILTSGGAVRAVDGTDRISEMRSLFKGDIMAAGKILPGQLQELHNTLHLNWYHGRNIL